MIEAALLLAGYVMGLLTCVWIGKRAGVKVAQEMIAEALRSTIVPPGSIFVSPWKEPLR